MGKKVIFADKVGIHTPAPLATKGLWSLGIEVDDFLFTAGQPGVDATGRIVGPDTQSQTKQALENLKAILEEAGFRFSDIAKIRIFMASKDDYEKVNEVRIPFYAEHFPDGDYPTSTAVRSPLAVPGLNVEIEAVACKRKRTYDVDDKIVKLIPLDLKKQPLWRLGAETDGLLWVTGQPGLDLEARLVGEDAATQVRQSLSNVGDIVEAGGFAFTDIVKLTTYLSHADDYESVMAEQNAILSERFPDRDFPAVTTVVAQMPPPGMLVEVEVVAARGEKRVIAAGGIASNTGSSSSHAIRVGDWIFLEGQGPFDKNGAVVGASDMHAQTRRTLENIKTVLEAAGGRFDSTVHFTIWIENSELYEPLNEARVPFYREHFPKGDFPASSAVVGPSPLPVQLLTIEVIAHAGA
jgi:2-iminobutanoate/2-iminopropanoate deaminase